MKILSANFEVWKDGSKVQVGHSVGTSFNVFNYPKHVAKECGGNYVVTGMAALCDCPRTTKRVPLGGFK